MRLPRECHDQSKETNWRHCVTGPGLHFFHKRKGILKIDQSVKMPWHGLSMEVACSYSSAFDAFYDQEYFKRCVIEGGKCWISTKRTEFSHGSLIPGKFDLKINRWMKTPWQEYSAVICSYSSALVCNYWKIAKKNSGPVLENSISNCDIISLPRLINTG